MMGSQGACWEPPNSDGCEGGIHGELIKYHHPLILAK